jgi:hypothetical protein
MTQSIKVTEKGRKFLEEVYKKPKEGIITLTAEDQPFARDITLMYKGKEVCGIKALVVEYIQLDNENYDNQRQMIADFKSLHKTNAKFAKASGQATRKKK